MKSYFAKLAARATLANVSVSSPLVASKTPDPFEVSAVTRTPSTSPDVIKSLSPSDVAQPLHSLPTPAPFQTQRVERGSQTVEPLRTESQEQEPTGRLPEVNQPVPPAERASEIKLEPLPSKVEIRSKVEHDAEVASPTTTSMFTPTVEAPQNSLANRVQDEAVDLGKRQTTLANDEHAEVQQEQAVMLRKADVFMEKLFNRRSESADRETVDDVEREAPAMRQSRREEPTRLQPMPHAAPTPEQSDDRPGLVIGKLTVEVMPSNPAPPAAQQDVVVVRRARSVRTVLPSSRRFGLGQF